MKYLSTKRNALPRRKPIRNGARRAVSSCSLDRRRAANCLSSHSNAPRSGGSTPSSLEVIENPPNHPGVWAESRHVCQNASSQGHQQPFPPSVQTVR